MPRLHTSKNPRRDQYFNVTSPFRAAYPPRLTYRRSAQVMKSGPNTGEPCLRTPGPLPVSMKRSAWRTARHAASATVRLRARTFAVSDSPEKEPSVDQIYAP
ncbi:hypothetical protein KCP74_24460 [Salmonella enterica subsp. enterica]|nr:hypothetical protein KCP74_24460 [Salmonella enterica subsp. enterica]